MTTQIDHMAATARRTVREFISEITARHQREFMGGNALPGWVFDVRHIAYPLTEDFPTVGGDVLRFPARQRNGLTIACDAQAGPRYFESAWHAPADLTIFGIPGDWMVGRIAVAPSDQFANATVTLERVWS